MKILKSIIHSMLPLFLMLSFSNTEVVAQNSHGVAFSIPANKNRIHPGSKPFRAYGNVIVTKKGKASSMITIDSNHFLLGFTGGVKITFKDKRNIAIYEVLTRGWGVNPGSSRTVSWSTTIPKWVVEHSKSASTTPLRLSTNKTTHRILAEGKKLALAYAASKAGK